MKNRLKIWRFHIFAAGAFLLAGILFLIVSLPLVQRERRLDRELDQAILQLAEAGHGMNRIEIGEKIERLEKEIESLSEIANDPSRTIRFSSEIEEKLNQPFQLIDFDGRKFFVLDNIRSLSREKKVELFNGWRLQFPTYTNQSPNRIWAQLALMDQLFQTAIHAGVSEIEAAELVSKQESDSSEPETTVEREIAVRLRVTGEMDAIHRLLLMLPLSDRELANLDFDSIPERKSAFFTSRFIIRKNSAEKPDEVQAELVVSGFLDTDFNAERIRF